MASRAILVPDTNVLLHAAPLDQIAWCDMAGVDAVEVVLVAQVLREVDAKKNGTSDKLRKRAQRVMSEIDKWIPSGAQRATLAKGVELRVDPGEPAFGPGLDPGVADDRILASVLELAAAGIAPVMVVTGDITMRFKAEAQKFRVLKVPEQFRLPDEERKEPAKAPRVTAGFWEEGQVGVSPNLAVKLGLSAADLLPEARQLLAESRHAASQTSGLPLSTLGSLYVREPSETDYVRYVEEIERYNSVNSRVFELVLGVANTGTSPADDVVAEFILPRGVFYYEDGPPLPKRPRRHDLFWHHIPHHPMHVERAESFSFDRLEDGSAHAEIRVKRLMQSKRTGYSVWVEVTDDALGGFSIEARVLVAAPASTSNLKLNLRIDRS